MRTPAPATPVRLDGPGGVGQAAVSAISQSTTSSSEPRCGEPGSLALGAGAPGEHLLGETDDLVGCAPLVECRGEEREQLRHHLGRGCGAHRPQVDQLAGGAEPRSAPAGGAQQLRAHGGERFVGLGEGHAAADERTGQTGDEHCIVDGGAHVGDAQLQRLVARRGPHVPVDPRRRVDRRGGQQLLDDLLVLGARGEVLGAAGGRPPTEHLAAVARVAGVPARPERRAGRQGGDRREPRPDVVHRRDGELAVGHADVHVAAEHDLLAGQVGVVLGDRPVVLARGDPLLVRGRLRVRPCGDDRPAHAPRPTHPPGGAGGRARPGHRRACGTPGCRSRSGSAAARGTPRREPCAARPRRARPRRPGAARGCRGGRAGTPPPHRS